MRFADIYGHDDVKARLRDMVDNKRIPHALLLEGPSGTSKFALARAFSQYIHCTNRTNGDSCGVCPDCIQHQTFNHIDTIYSFPVVKKKGGGATISEDYLSEFREFMEQNPYMDFEQWLECLDNINAQPQIYVEEGKELLRRLTFMTRKAKYKVVLLWLPERMREDTANKLLKLIEEPFGDTIFLMVSNNPRGILPTIYSRTQRISVKRYDIAELTDILIHNGILAGNAADIARVAEGSVNTALRLSQLNERQLKHLELFTELMRKAYSRQVAALREWSKTVADLGREPAMQFIDYAARLVRESFLMHLAVDELLTVSAAERAFLSKFHPFINEKNVEEIIALFDRARRDIAANGNSKIILFDTAVRIIILLRR